MTTTWLFGIGMLGVLAVVLLGWIVPLTIGIGRRRRKQGGGALMIVGGVWAAVGVSLMAVIGFGIARSVRMARTYRASEFSAAEYQGPTGWVSVNWPESLEFTIAGAGAKGETLRVQGTNGMAVSPAGSFTMTSVGLSGSSDDGLWTASAYFPKGRPVTIESGATNALPAGPPFVASIDVEPIRDTNVAFNFRLLDSQGDSWQIRKTGAGGRPPGFEVRTPEDLVVWRGNFQYG